MKTELLINSIKKISTALVLTGVLLMSSFAVNAIAPIAYMEDWEDVIAMENGWTGDFTWVAGTGCIGFYGMEKSFTGSTITGSLISPNIGKARGAKFTNLIGINYFITGSLGTGTIDIQYAASLGGPWISVGVIDASNHVVSTTCSHFDVPQFVLAKGANVYMRFVVTRNTGTFDLYIADIFFANMCTNGKLWGKMRIDPCWGITVNDFTWYRGLSQWMPLKAKAGGGIGTYTWTIVSGTGSIVGTGHSVYLFEAEGPITINVSVNFGHCSYQSIIFSIIYNDTYWAGTPTDPWILKVCEAGVNTSEPYSVAKTKVCSGPAVLGWGCVPKTNIVSESGDFSLSVYPNPTNEEFKLNINNASNSGLIEIYDLNSRLILEKDYEPTKGDYSFDVNEKLVPGMYIIRVVSGEEMLVQKLVVY